LEEIDGVSGAYVNNDIQLFFTEETDLDKELVATKIAKYGMKVKGSEKMKELPF
jgi:hypothetical protein